MFIKRSFMFKCIYQLIVVVKLGTVEKSPGPGEDGGDRVGRCILALLVHAVVAGHGAVSG